MRITVKLPKLTDAGDDAAVVEWLVQPGEPVAEGAGLVTVETAKAQVDVPSPVAGVLVAHLVGVDDELSTGDALATIEA